MRKRKNATSLPQPSVRCAFDEMVPIERLKPHPRNPNTHPKEQIRLLGKIIRAQGWRGPVVVSERSGYVVAGHGRLMAAQEIGATEVPVDYQAFANESEETAHLIADNRIAELAEIDRTALRELAEALDDGAFDMETTGFDSAALEELMTAAPPESDMDAEPQIDKAKELAAKWGIERGQIWELGAHRLMCGDATNANDVEVLAFSGHLMVTDPPYGVEYNADWRTHAKRKVNGKLLSVGAHAIGKVENDNRFDWTTAWQLFNGDAAYVWHAGRYAAEVQASLDAAGFDIRSQIIWAKNNMVIGRGDYHWKHEPCWYAVRKGKTGHWQGDRSQTTVWDIDKPMRSESGHSTQKPVECMAKPIRNNSAVGEEVYEPFSGSGTTIIACEQLGRKCRAMEIDPGYVAVAIQRWADATGKTPKLIHGH